MTSEDSGSKCPLVRAQSGFEVQSGEWQAGASRGRKTRRSDSTDFRYINFGAEPEASGAAHPGDIGTKRTGLLSPTNCVYIITLKYCTIMEIIAKMCYEVTLEKWPF